MKVRTQRKFRKKITASLMLFICPLLLAVVLTASLAVAGAIFSENTKTVIISDGCALYELTADCDTVSEALSLVGIEIEEDEVLNCALTDDVENVDIIRISRKIEYNKVESSGYDTLVNFKVIDDSEIVDEEDSHFEQKVPVLGEELPLPSIKPGVPVVTPEPAPVITLEYEDIIEEIAFDITYIEDNTMYEGDSRVVSEGENGIKTYVYEITLTDGVETERELVKVKDTKAPVNKVVAVGTISNFTNSRGDKVAFTNRVEVVATAYTNDAKWGDLLYWTNQLGNLRAQWGVIAVDPNVIPLGTKVYVKSVDGSEDYGFAICADIGGSIKGHRIDLWMDNDPLCNVWGVRGAEVYILEDQSVDVFALRNGDEWEA